MFEIKFGTDGWRERIAGNFTFANLSRLVDAYAVWMREKSGKPRVAVGYDLRFLSEKYAAFTAEKLKNCGFSVFLFDRAVHTPLVSWAIKNRKYDGGIMITSSHNPYIYNGLKIKNGYGAGAPPEETDQVEKLIRAGIRPAAARGRIEKINLDAGYIEAVRDIVDVDLIKKSGMKIVLDVMYGSGAGYMERVLGNYGGLTVIHNRRDPLFGGINPEPIRKNLLELERAVKEQKADLGLAIDGDGDRMAFVDDMGRYVPTHKALVFLLVLHAKYKKMEPRFIKTISGTSLLYRVAAEYGVKLLEVPVGFKYIGEKIIEDKNTIGGRRAGVLDSGISCPSATALPPDCSWRNLWQKKAEARAA